MTGHCTRVIATLAALIAMPTGSAGAAQTVAVRDADLHPYAIVDGAIPKPLTAVPGDSARGRDVVLDRKLGNCLTCHNIPIPKAADQGNVGPDLHGVGKLTEGQLRLRVVNMKVLDPQTIMPAYYRVDGLKSVGKEFAGKPILSAQQIEDLVAFLKTLK
ncbi:MAG: hypothetical protein NVS1B14_10750 [Vulcanimicrobiaceae bacterium]